MKALNPAEEKGAVKIGLVSCSKLKLSSPRPAESLYISPLFRMAKSYVKRCYDRWYILSAKYYLVEPGRIIEPYDETLNGRRAAERRLWSSRVYRQLRAVLPPPRKCRIFFHAGRHYYEHLVRWLSADGYACEVPLAGLGIGQQLKWYKCHEKSGLCHKKNQQEE